MGNGNETGLGAYFYVKVSGRTDESADIPTDDCTFVWSSTLVERPDHLTVIGLVSVIMKLEINERNVARRQHAARVEKYEEDLASYRSLSVTDRRLQGGTLPENPGDPSGAARPWGRAVVQRPDLKFIHGAVMVIKKRRTEMHRQAQKAKAHEAEAAAGGPHTTAMLNAMLPPYIWENERYANGKGTKAKFKALEEGYKEQLELLGVASSSSPITAIDNEMPGGSNDDDADSHRGEDLEPEAASGGGGGGAPKVKFTFRCAALRRALRGRFE
jgi:hypothetical protein